jgi:PIN domain nuclease of toxin-antitoxin system
MDNMLLDTHALVWLYSGMRDKFSKKGIELIQSANLLSSPASLLEIEFLREIGRVNDSGSNIIDTLKNQLALELTQADFETVMRASLKENWTRDPFDRMIVAEARIYRCKLLSRDRKIGQFYKHAIW